MENKRQIIYGVNAVTEVLNSKNKNKITKILISDTRKNDEKISRIISLAKKGNIQVVKENLNTINNLCKTSKNQGILAVLLSVDNNNIDEFISNLPENEDDFPKILILDGVEDPGNLGAILRSALSFGIKDVVLPKRRSAGITSTVSKTSAGALSHMSIYSVNNIAGVLDKLKEKGYWITSVEADGDKICGEAELLTPMALVMGGENTGIRRIVRDKSDMTLSIPMEKGAVSSLNVSCAASVVFYEILRQEKVK